ncbi:MAG: homocysteine S-methyltransferase family protein [Planctomycetota bacterium]
MGRMSLRDRIKKGLFLLDGAMGTQLIARGVEASKCNDYLNIDSPDTIVSIHKNYLEAGSDTVLTNTFGANKYALARHGLSEEATKINTAGAQTARKAAGENKYVLGDIGPSGDFLEPLGALKPDELEKAFAEQAQVLLAGGVDGFIIETMTALDEMAIAIEAVKSVSELPVFASMAFDSSGDDFRTMMGVDVETAVSKMVLLGVDAVGFNCGKMSLDDYIRLAVKCACAVQNYKEDVVVLAEPNAGTPELVEGKAIYNVPPDAFATAAEKICSAGVKIIGGCCGTGPEHIQAIAEKLK